MFWSEGGDVGGVKVVKLTPHIVQWLEEQDICVDIQQAGHWDLEFLKHVLKRQDVEKNYCHS